MRQALSPHSRANPSRFTRDDVAAVTSVYKRETVRFNRWGSGLLIAGLLTGALLMGIADFFGWAQSLDPFFLLGGWALGLGGMAVASGRRRRAMVDINLHCGTCSTPLIQPGSLFRPNSDKVALARAELIVATGGCPTCGGDFLAVEA